MPRGGKRPGAGRPKGSVTKKPHNEDAVIVRLLDAILALIALLTADAARRN